MKPYSKSNIPLAKDLRKNMTPWERKLWYDFLRSYPVRFQRQKAIGNYIADFYCAKARLIIELDGSGIYYSVKASQQEMVVILNEGDTITVSYKEAEGEIIAASSLEVGGEVSEEPAEEVEVTE